jgi:hypothetical protein
MPASVICLTWKFLERVSRSCLSACRVPAQILAYIGPGLHCSHMQCTTNLKPYRAIQFISCQQWLAGNSRSWTPLTAAWRHYALLSPKAHIFQDDTDPCFDPWRRHCSWDGKFPDDLTLHQLQTVSRSDPEWPHRGCPIQGRCKGPWKEQVDDAQAVSQQFWWKVQGVDPYP